MLNITNYSYLIQSMFGGTKATWGVGSTLPGMFQCLAENHHGIVSELRFTKRSYFKGILADFLICLCAFCYFRLKQSVGCRSPPYSVQEALQKI